MKTLLQSLLLAVCCLALSCNTVPIQGTSTVTATGQDLNTLAAQATMAYSDYKAGNVNYAWAAAQALQAYQTISKTSTDVKALIQQWTGDGTFAEKLARSFRASNAPPQEKMKALAKSVTAVLTDPGP